MESVPARRGNGSLRRYAGTRCAQGTVVYGGDSSFDVLGSHILSWRGLGGVLPRLPLYTTSRVSTPRLIVTTTSYE